MRCIVTAGPTYEPLDEARRLTNFSTGRLGSELAGFLTAGGHEVTLLIGQQATFHGERSATLVRTFTTTSHLLESLQSLSSPSFDAVFHAAAVSDFRFGKVWRRASDGQLTEIRAGKISTRCGTLVAELVPTPKVIAELRSFFPKARIVGWKYEVEGDKAALVELARKQMAECRTNVCVVNGPAYGRGFCLVKSETDPVHLPDRAALFPALELVASPAVR